MRWQRESWPPRCRDPSRRSWSVRRAPLHRQAVPASSVRLTQSYGDEDRSPVRAGAAGGSGCLGASLPFDERAVLANQEVEVLALLVREFEEDLFAFRVLE